MAPRSLSRQLPVEMTSFVGRRQETAEVKHLLGQSRLVTLTGPGGVGKSRLARHVAAGLHRSYPDGLWLVELANVRGPGQVAHELAGALGLWERAMRDPEAVLTGYLAQKRALVVLDGCEHVLDACRDLVETVLAAAPRVRVLATSRQPLGAAGEAVWQVPPLSVPQPDEPASRRHEAVTLFEARVRLSMPDFSVNAENAAAVARLCARLDGIPLAIELAAVRMRSLTAEQLLDRIEDRFRLLTQGPRSAPHRQQTLRATVDWSYDLCSPVERAVWVRCAVFTGNFDIEAAKDVCAGDGLSESDVVAAVGGLVGKSVLMRGDSGQSTYRMLETIRQYGLERLAESDQEPVLRRRHRDHYLRVAERADVDSVGARQTTLGPALLAERDNFLAALEFCLATPGEARIGLRMASAMWYCWVVLGCLRDGRQMLERFLALDREPTAVRAKALWVAGWIAHLQSDHDAALALHRESATLARMLGDELTIIQGLHFQGVDELRAGNVAAGARVLEEALDRHRAQGRWTAPGLLVFSMRARAAGQVGDTDRAMALLEECRSICEPLGERWALAWAEWNIGVMWWAAGKPDRAVTHLRRALRDKDAVHDKLGVACAIEVLAWVAIARGEGRRSAVLFGAATRLWDQIGSRLFAFQSMFDLGRVQVERTKEALGRRAFDAAAKVGAEMSDADVVAYALGVKTPPARAQPKSELTKRERQVAELVAEGLSNKDIAARLVISQRTAESHLDHIFSKLGFTSRRQIADWVAERRER